MNKAKEDQSLMSALGTLITGLAQQALDDDTQFLYQGSTLYADEVSDLLLPSILCLAQNQSDHLGMGGFGYGFDLDHAGCSDALPLLVHPIGELAPFHRIAPFVLQIYLTTVIENHSNVLRVFEMAAQTIDGEFCLERQLA